MNATDRQFRILGTTDSVSSCDCCGKSNLKQTVAVIELDARGDEVTGETLHFGTTCAARASRREVKEVRNEAAAADRAAAGLVAAERSARHDRYMAAWTAHLVARTGGLYFRDGSPRILDMVNAIGGHAAAKVGFVAPDWTGQPLQHETCGR
jgi:hypothetical protein